MPRSHQAVFVPLSGERFRVVYRIRGSEDQAHAIARDICVEQTIEFPLELTPVGDLRDHIVGRIEELDRLDDSHWRVVISYAVETTGFELTQLLNVVFGNFSLKPGVRVEWLDLPPSLARGIDGPRFGCAGLRARLGAWRRPLLCTALKPMGLPIDRLADLAYSFARGGIDVIKDDHGLANQPFAPFDERVQRCADAVARANRETGLTCIYAPNVTAPGDAAVRHARYAKSAGAGGILISPGLAGLGVMSQLAADDGIDLPIFSHPSFLGSFITSPDQGIAPGVLFGQIARLAGADASIYPNYGGRFSLTREDCRAIAEAAAGPLAGLAPIFPVPGGGMTVERVPELLEFYGPEVILLIGGGLHQHGPDLTETCRDFRRLVERF